MSPTTSPATLPHGIQSEAKERAITRDVLQLFAQLYPLQVLEGRIVIPPEASAELELRIRRVEGELLFALGKESGPRWGCSWVPARRMETE